MADWHPVQIVVPVEWMLRNGGAAPFAAIHRRVIRERPTDPGELWFRVSTWESPPEVIGWCRTLEAAAAAGWDWHLAANRWRHELAARRVDPRGQRRPAAAELLAEHRARGRDSV